MRKRILLFSLLITFLGIFVFSLISTSVYYKSSVEHSKEYLRVYMNAFGEQYALDNGGAAEFSERLNGARVTFMDTRGNVTGDSDADGTLENHADREEFILAVANGDGFAVRNSETVGKDMIYYCKYFAGEDCYIRIGIPTSSEWALFAQSLPSVAGYLIVDVLMCLLFTFLSTYFILDPVKKIANEASANMTVNTKYAELEPIAYILNERNRSIRLQLKEINEEKELAVRARASKDEFITNVTHEMNTPLTSIKGYAELLSVGGLNEEQKQTAYKTILSQSERLTNLISCMINYSEIDNDDLPSYEVDLSALARETLAALKPEADKRNITLIDDIRDNVKIFSRHERMSEILGNLIRNAIRYNKEGGSVTVSLDFTRLSVEDTGIGIAEENIDKIFSRFFTVDKSHGGKNGGFGLGLAVVRKICRRAGWKIYVQSEPDKGSKFTVEF